MHTYTNLSISNDVETVSKFEWLQCIIVYTDLGVQKHDEVECGPMPNLMVALPNIGGALCSTPQSLADAHY